MDLIIIIIIIIIIRQFINKQHNTPYQVRRSVGYLQIQKPAIPIQALIGPQGSRKLRLPEFLQNPYMKVIRLSVLRTRFLHSPGSIPGTHICHRLSQPQGNNVAGKSKPMENRHDLIGNGTRDLVAYSAVPQPIAPPRTPVINI